MIENEFDSSAELDIIKALKQWVRREITNSIMIDDPIGRRQAIIFRKALNAVLEKIKDFEKLK